MPKRTWEVTIDDLHHVIELERQWSGRQKIRVDGAPTRTSWKLSDTYQGRQTFFLIGEHLCIVEAFRIGLGFDFALLVDNVLVGSPSIVPEQIAQWSPRWLNELAYWQDIGRALGLRYFYSTKDEVLGQHRLVGWMDGYLVLVKYRQVQRKYRYTTSAQVLVRYRPALDLKDLRSRMQADETLKQLEGHMLKGRLSIIGERHAALFMPYRIKKDPSDVLASQTREFVRTVAKYVEPLPSATCEVQDCQSDHAEPPGLVFVNDWPLLLCPSCLAKIEARGNEIERAYSDLPEQPAEIIRRGLPVVLLASIVCAIGLILFRDYRVVALLAVMPIGILFYLEKRMPKRTLLNYIVAALFAESSFVAGAVIASFWISDVKLLWREILLPVLFGLISVSLYIPIALKQTDKRLGEMLNPTIQRTGQDRE